MKITELLSIIGALAALAALVGGLYAVFRSSSQDNRIKRLQDENADYVKRLNYIEPKLVELTQQNTLLKQLQNPTATLEVITTTTAANGVKADKMLEVLNEQTVTLAEIKAHNAAGAN